MPAAPQQRPSSRNGNTGRTLVIYLCLFTFLSGLVLLLADRMGLSRERGSGIGGAIGQAGPPFLALVAALL